MQRVLCKHRSRHNKKLPPNVRAAVLRASHKITVLTVAIVPWKARVQLHTDGIKKIPSEIGRDFLLRLPPIENSVSPIAIELRYLMRCNLYQVLPTRIEKCD